MSWLKNKLQTWLEVKVQHQCEHHWEVLKTLQVEELFQMPPQKLGSFYLSSLDKTTYKRTKTKYIMSCTKCGDLKAEVL